MEEYNLSKKKINLSKKGIIAIIVAAVILVVGVISAVYIGQNKVKVISDLAYMLMDKEQPFQDDSGRIMKIRKNPAFDKNAENVQLFDAYELYYTDDNGTEYSYLYNDKIEADGVEVGADMVMGIFTLSALQKVKTIASIVIPIVVLALIALVIFLWFKSWSRREDQKNKKLPAKTSKNTKKKK